VPGWGRGSNPDDARSGPGPIAIRTAASPPSGPASIVPPIPAPYAPLVGFRKLGPQIGIQTLLHLAQRLRLGNIDHPRQFAIDIEVAVERVERIITGLLRVVNALTGPGDDCAHGRVRFGMVTLAQRVERLRFVEHSQHACNVKPHGRLRVRQAIEQGFKHGRTPPPLTAGRTPAVTLLIRLFWP